MKWSDGFENICYYKIIILFDGVVVIIDIVFIENNFLDIFISVGFRFILENYIYIIYVFNYLNCREVIFINDF